MIRLIQEKVTPPRDFLRSRQIREFKEREQRNREEREKDARLHEEYESFVRDRVDVRIPAKVRRTSKVERFGSAAFPTRETQSGELVGGHLIGAEVTELIQGFAIATTLKSTADQLLDVLFPHPTLSETMRESTLAALGRAIHV